MNAPAKPMTETQIRQSLTDRWRDGRNDLLQLYGSLEKMLAARLSHGGKGLMVTPDAHRTFGKKLLLTIKSAPAFKVHADLGPLRNLLAHTNFDIVTIGEDLSVVLSVADIDNARNARVIAGTNWRPFLDQWRAMLQQALDDARRLPVHSDRD
jgi:hypothetical protein